MRIWIATTTLALGVSGLATAQVSMSNFDDFEDGTTQNWTNGLMTSDVSQVPDGGPDGAGDGYLQVIGNGGVGAGSVPAALNATQWAGDYLIEGIARITLDMANFGPNDADMRIVVFGTNFSRWTSNVSQLVPADGVWRQYEFSILEEDLNNVFNFGTYEEALSDVDHLMFRNQSGPPAGGGTALLTTLGFDNIRPKPAPCDGDLNGCGTVDGQDLAILLGAWGPCEGGAAGCLGDINNSGAVDGADLAVLLGGWGACP